MSEETNHADTTAADGSETREPEADAVPSNSGQSVRWDGPQNRLPVDSWPKQGRFAIEVQPLPLPFSALPMMEVRPCKI